MTIISLYHHLGYKPNREEIKKIIEVDNNITEAKTLIENLITEHDELKNTYNDDETIMIDNSSLHHAKDHLQYADVQIQQKDATIKALDEI